MTAQPPLWILGAFVCIAGCLLSGLGLVLQKYSHWKDKGRGANYVHYLAPWWMLGFLVFIGGQALTFVAMAFAPQAVLGALSMSSIVFIGMFAWLILGERLQLLEAFSMLGAVVSMVLVAFAVPERHALEGKQSVMVVAGSVVELDFLGIAIAVVAILFGMWGSILYCAPGLAPIFWSCVTGTLAGYTYTLWKCVSMILIDCVHPWAHWQGYLIVLVTSLMSCVQIHTMNLALCLGHAKAVVTTTLVVGLTIQIMNSQLAYEELNQMHSGALVMFWVGIVGVLVSLVGIVHSQLSADDKEFDEEHVEEAEAAAAPMLKPSRRRATTGSQELATAATDYTQVHNRRNSSYFGIRNAPGGHGRVYPFVTGGLIFVT